MVSSESCLLLLMLLECPLPCPVEGGRHAVIWLWVPPLPCHTYISLLGHWLRKKPAAMHVVSILHGPLETDLARKEMLIVNTSLYQACKRATLDSVSKTLARSWDARFREESEHLSLSQNHLAMLFVKPWPTDLWVSKCSHTETDKCWSHLLRGVNR